MRFPQLNDQGSGSVLQRLRALRPPRTLTYGEARSVAERQALRLVRILAIREPAELLEGLHSLPRISIAVEPNLPACGLSQWTGSRWQILVSADDAQVRQRFTAAHELKHILDHHDAKSGQLHQALKLWTPDEETEKVCDFFAGCLLMPRPWMKSAITRGVQDLGSLARVFGVSRQAMKVRLDQTGLADCVQLLRVDQTLRSRRDPWYPPRVGPTYFRSPVLVGV